VDELSSYLNSLNAQHHQVLQGIRDLVHSLVPDTEESMSYGIPTLKHKGKLLLHFAGFKDHMSIFPGAQAIQILGKDLKNYKTSKGTVQFTLANPISAELIKKIIDIRLAEINK